MNAQEAIIVSPPQVGYDTSIIVTIKLKDLPPLTSPVAISSFRVENDFKADSITIINDSILVVRLYTGVSIDTGLNTLRLSYSKQSFTTSNGIWIRGSRLKLNEQSFIRPRRGYTQKCDFIVDPYYTSSFGEDSILSIACLDSLGKITSNIVCDSFKMGIDNHFFLNVQVKESVFSGTFKLVIVTQKNGILKYLLTIRPPQIAAIGSPRGVNSFGLLEYRDNWNNVLFKKGAPNSIKIYRNGEPRTDFSIDSTNAFSENTLRLYGKVSPNAEYGDYQVVIQNQYDSLSLVFTVFKPKIQSISIRSIQRGDSISKGITMQYANLTKGTTTLSLLNPADSAFIKISNFSVTNANNCRFILKVDSLAPLGNYFIKLTNSFDTISIIDSFFIPKDKITVINTNSIPSERQSVIELQSNYTLFGRGPISLWAKATTSGSITIDSFAVLSNTRLKLWITADGLATGFARFFFYSPMDDSITVSSFNIRILRPEARFTNNKNVTMGIKDTITLSIIGISTRFKRLKNIQSTYEVPGGIAYDNAKIKVLGYTVQSDSLLSVTIGTNENLFLSPSVFKLSLLDSVSGELILSNSIQLTNPSLVKMYRTVIKKQANDTIWLPLASFSESQMENIDSVYFILNQMPSTSIKVKNYSYKMVGNLKGILLNIEMNKTAKSGDFNFVKIVWNLQPGYFNSSDNIRSERPVFISESIPRLTKDSVSKCILIFDGLFEDSVNIKGFISDVSVNNIKINGDTIEFDAKPLRTGFSSYTVTTPNESIIHSGSFFLNLPVGVDETMQPSSFQVYPIPVQHSISIYSNDNTIIKGIIIYNMLGKSLSYEGTNTNLQKIDLDNLPAGAYSMYIYTNKGTENRKFLKE